MIGTAATRIGASRTPTTAHATTPEAPALQARAARDGSTPATRAAVIETTSHGLALERVGSIAYDVAILTNVTHEHLELHGTLEAYRDAKLSLFERLAPRRDAAPSRRAAPGRGPASSTSTIPSAGLFIGVDPGGRRPGR